MIRPIAVLLAVVIAAATVVTTASIADRGASRARTRTRQRRARASAPRAPLTQDSCDPATGRTNFEVVGGCLVREPVARRQGRIGWARPPPGSPPTR